MPSATDRPLPLRFVLFLGPLVLTNVLQALAGTLNNIYLGRMLGAQAMASAVSFFPVFMFLLALVIGLGTGASILVGQARGAQDTARVQRIAGTVLLSGALLGGLIALPGLGAARPLMVALGTPAEVLPDAVVYARIMMAGLPVFFLSLLAAALLRGLGDSVTPLRALLVSCSASALLTPALIAGWLGLPRLGVASAALASVAATASGLAWLAWRLKARGHELAGSALAGYVRLDAALLRTVVRLGVPTALFFLTGSLADMALLSLVNRHGVHATAAWGTVNQVIAYVLFPAMSIAIAASVFAAQAIGAGRLAQVPHVAQVGLVMNLLLTGSLAVLVALFAVPVAGLFVREPAVVELAAQALRLCVWGSVIFGLASVYSSVMRAAGTVRVPTLISLSCLALLMFPLGWAFGQALGLAAIWLAYPVTYGCALLLQALYYHGVWKRRPIHRLA